MSKDDLRFPVVLIATKELRYLFAKVDALKTTLYCTTISIESTLRHASHSFEAGFQSKAFWEDLQRNLVAFKHTAKTFNNAVHMKSLANSPERLSFLP